ncbi:MAG: FimV/HubP family polar landmark protein [Nitrosospira sp.]
MMLCPVAGHAAGLGRLAVNSALGQPFKAEIDLVAIKKEEKSSLMVRIAPEEIFRQANVDYVSLLSTFKATIENRPDGQPHVRITSSQPVADPLLNMLVELNWSSGRLLREYTIVLGPPEIDVQPSATPSIHTTPPVSIKTESAAVEKSGLKIKTPISGEKKLGVLELASASKSRTVYGPVKRGDTLGGIVRNIASPPGVSFNQMLVALHRANREAFFGNNMHQLKTGPILRVPDGGEIDTITPAEADREVELQTADWNRHRTSDVIGATPAVDKLKQTVTGKIEPISGAEATEVQESPYGFLKVSRGKELWNADHGGEKDIGRRYLDEKNSGREAGSVQDRVNAMEEDAVAKSRSLSEANERIALLEKNIKELQHLLALKNLALADTQQTGAAKLDAIALPAPPAATLSQSGLTPAPDSATSHAPVTAEADNPKEAITFPADVGSATEIAKPTHVAARSNPEADSTTPRRLAKNSLIDNLTTNIEYFGGALVLLITGIVGVSIIGRPKEEFVCNSNADIVSTSNHELHDKADPSAETAGRGTTLLIGQTGLADQVNDADQALKIAATTGDAGAPENIGGSSESVPPSVSPESSIIPPAERGLGDISLNLDGTMLVQPTELADRNTHWHEIITKLDLARAYREMGDKEAARQVLQEVAREGDPQQQESAAAILVNL